MDKQTTDYGAIKQSMGLVSLAKPLTEDLSKKIASLFTDEEIGKFRRFMVTGCGDSYIAGVATKKAFDHLVKMDSPVEAVTTPELAYHVNPRKFKYGKTLMVGVSISGKARGTFDAVNACKEKGAFTVGITEDLNSPLGKAADRVIKHDSTETELAPGTKTYFTSVLTLLLLAVHMGEAKGRYSSVQAEEYRKAIVDYVEAFGPKLEEINSQVKGLVDKYVKCTHFDCAGSDTDYASAWFARAKVYEATGIVTAVENTEDWCHVDYYARNPQDIGTIVFLNSDNTAKSRMMETIETMAHIKRPTLVVTDLPGSEFPDGVDVVVIPKAKYDWMAPLMQFMPITLLCGYLQLALGEKPLRGLEGVWGKVNGNSIYVPNAVPQYAFTKREEEK